MRTPTHSPVRGAFHTAPPSGTEDAPAPTALHSFKAYVAYGKIYVTADPSNTLKKNLSRQPTIPTSFQDNTPGVVIVGGGSGAFQTVESLREVRMLLLLAMRGDS